MSDVWPDHSSTPYFMLRTVPLSHALAHMAFQEEEEKQQQQKKKKKKKKKN